MTNSHGSARWTAVLVVLLMVAGFVATGCQGGGGKKESIKFGVIGSYTGPNAKPGQSMKQGVQLAVDEINKAGGVGGQMIEPIFEDDASVPAQSVSATEKLVTKDEVRFLIGTFNSATTLADMKVIDREKIPMLVPIAVAIEITESGNKWVFRNSATNPMQAEQLMNYIYNNTKNRKFAVIHENTDYGKGLASAVTKYITEKGGQVHCRVLQHRRYGLLRSTYEAQERQTRCHYHRRQSVGRVANYSASPRNLGSSLNCMDSAVCRRTITITSPVEQTKD